ncbi:Uncharacterised protein [Mycobacteroides abscessus subsp. abscessus]|nr:Uncharacterised protein [Mycobacteroides abscessus subsp. abscessus]
MRIKGIRRNDFHMLRPASNIGCVTVYSRHIIRKQGFFHYVHGRRSDKARGKDILGIMIDSHRAVSLLIMRHIYKGGAELLVKLDQLCPHLDSQLRIQVGEGLIQNEYLRLLYHGPGERYPLPLSA